jgi:hypothetical protein
MKMARRLEKYHFILPAHIGRIYRIEGDAASWEREAELVLPAPIDITLQQLDSAPHSRRRSSPRIDGIPLIT